MNDDWRLRVRLRERGLAHALSERLDVADLEHDLERAFPDRVIVSIDGPELFCYAGTREQADRAEALIRNVAAQHRWEVETELSHWHPSAERWMDPDAPLPDDEAAAHAERVERERAEAAAQGYPGYEVRVMCDSREHASQVADVLRGEGLPSVQRYRYLLLGAVDEDSARALAERVAKLVPAEASVTVGVSGRALQGETGGNPFAILGGLGG
jgi:hypothetical protein